jgi:hypothetical protein
LWSRKKTEIKIRRIKKKIVVVAVEEKQQKEKRKRSKTNTKRMSDGACSYTNN